MKQKFHWAVTLYILSFLLPVIQLNSFGLEESLYGWEAAQKVIFTWDYGVNNLVDSTGWQLFHYIIANLANPLVLVVIILHYSGKNNTALKWLLSLIAIISALYWMPYFFGYIFDYFSFGYWTWLGSIIMIHYFSNNSSFKRPRKDA